MATCSVEGCDRTVLARDLCNKHYQRWLVSTRSTHQKTCTVEGCDGVVQARGWCAKHYTCSVEGCDKIVQARGWCNKHYIRWLRHGDPLVVLQAEHGAPQAFIEMALRHQDKETCLYWPYGRDDNGYAIHNVGTAESQYVHRRICEAVKGPPPSSKHEACHSCGKGHLGCINPHHLKWDTPPGNAADKIIHGTDSKGERNGNAILTWEKVHEIKAMKGTTLTQSEVGSIFGVSRITISNIWSGKIWKE